MFNNFIDKCKALLNNEAQQRDFPSDRRASSHQNKAIDRRIRIFDNDRQLTSHSKSRSFIDTDELKDILTPRQLTFHFDMELYRKLNRPSRSADIVGHSPASPDIKVQLLKDNLSLVTNYKMMTDRVKLKDGKGYSNVNFTHQELQVFSSTDEIRAIGFVFQKYRGLIERRGVLEHQTFIENELFEAREYFSAQLLKTDKTYLKQIELSFKRLDGLAANAATTYTKIKTLRANLQKLHELNTHKKNMDIKFKKQEGAQKMLIIMNKLNYKFPKVVKLLEQSFSIHKAGQAYKMLVVSALYCIKKLDGGYYLYFIRKLYQRIEDRLMYLKHKLKQNFYYELRQGSEGRPVAMERVDEMIKQFVQIEKQAFHFYKPNLKDTHGLNTMLEKDTDLFSRHIREVDERTPQLLESNILRVKLTQLYNYYKSSVN